MTSPSLDQLGWTGNGPRSLWQKTNPDGTGSSSTWIEPDCTTTAFESGAFAAQPVTRTEVAGREVPTTWAVQLPAKDIDVEVSALNPMAWMGVSIPYWEGPVTVSGAHSGGGYLEMTGYE